ncbi:DNA translocase FtsK [Paenibacillus sp. 481]|nr:DNA translocase FtsK [Paenibacillus sp. 481]
MLQKDISGGYIGAALYCVLFSLFGGLGTKLLIIVLMFIGFMLITQMSYIELIRLIRAKVSKITITIMKKRRARMNERKVQSGRKRKAMDDEDLLPDHMDNEDEDEELLDRERTPIFYQLFGGRKKAKQREHWDEDEEYMEKDKRFSERPRSFRSDENDSDVAEAYAAERHNRLQNEDEINTQGNELQQPTPLFRDFTATDSTDRAHEMDEVHHIGRASSSTQDDVEDDLEEPLPISLHTPNAEEVDPMTIHSNDSTEVNTDATDQQSIEHSELSDPPKPPPKPYKLPSFQLLSKPQGSGKGGDHADYMQTARKLEATLESFGVRAKVLEVVRGPAVTRYEIQPDIGVKVSRIVSLSDDIALALAAKDIRMEAPIPGKSAIGIEVPNNEVSVVTMREVMETQTFLEASSRLSITLGRDISGAPIVGNLARMPHLLVAGATGSGKSVCINGIITSVLYKAKPDEVKFLMIDPKMVELNVYNGIPHLLAPVVTDPRRASLALKKIVVEMEKRYELFSKSGTRNIEGYNNLVAEEKEKVLPFIVVIVDELADLMMVAANDVEDAICRLAQMARAAGIHLIIATQRPSVDVITGVIKANIPSRIAFGVSSQVDSRTILDMAGAEKLLGRGDMLYLPMGSSKPIRVQGAFLSDQEVETVVTFCRDQGQAEYNEDLVPEIDENGLAADEPIDELYEQAVQMVLEAQQASASLLQRRMRIGYNRASRLIDHMNMQGIIGPHEGSRPREVLMTWEQYQHTKKSS